MRKYKVISLDVWGNEADGYEVNAAYTTSYTLEFTGDEYITDNEIVQALIEQGLLDDTVTSDQISIHGEADYTLFIDDNTNDYPLYQLEAVR